MMSKLNFHVVQNSVEKRERENMLALGKPRRRETERRRGRRGEYRGRFTGVPATSL